MNFQVKKFHALSGKEVYDICRLRAEVFVLEQAIICEEELDGKDFDCIHVFLYEQEEMVAYCRIVPEFHTHYGTPTIGRVVVKATHRKKGLAEKMMRVAMQVLQDELGSDKIVLSAQAYVSSLYAHLGFVTVSDIYEEAGIPHVKMKWEKK